MLVYQRVPTKLPRSVEKWHWKMMFLLGDETYLGVLAVCPQHFLQSYGHLLVITGYFYGVIHSINGYINFQYL